MKCLLLLMIPAVLVACKHPLEIEGQGDILELNGTGRGCTLEQYRAGAKACTENEVTDTGYDVSRRTGVAPAERQQLDILDVQILDERHPRGEKCRKRPITETRTGGAGWTYPVGFVVPLDKLLDVGEQFWRH